MKYRILGSLTVEHNGRTFPPAQRKTAEIITTLGAHDGWVDSARLQALLWEETESDNRPGALRSHIYTARQYLDDPHGDRLVSKRGFGYQLRLHATDELDLTSFRRLHDEGTTAFRRGDPVTAVHLLGRALALWPADSPLCDFPRTTTMSQQIVKCLHREHTAAQDAWLEGRLILGEHRALLPILESLLVDNPVNERLLAMYVTALYRCGQQAEALRVYEQARTTLAEQGIEPAEEIKVIAQRIEQDDPNLRGPGPLSTRGPNHVAPAVPRQLPAVIPDFTGRGRDEEKLTQILRTGDDTTAIRQVVVCGPPGTGKSTLAVRVGHIVQDEFPDGQLYVGLEDANGHARDPKSVLAEILRVLGVLDAAVPETMTERTALFRSLLAGRQVLLVLDNAADPRQVRPLMPGAAGCGVIITTQNQLISLMGPHLLRLRPLARAESFTVLRNIAGSRRVERAEAEPLIAACAGLPLALRVVGSRLQQGLSPQGLAALLSDPAQRLDELSAGELDVRASIAHSYQRLGAAEAKVLRTITLLGIADCAPWLISIALGEDCSRTLAILADHSLIERQMDTFGRPRYHPYDLISAYLREQIPNDPDASRTLKRTIVGTLELMEIAGSYYLPRDDNAPAPDQPYLGLIASDEARRMVEDDAIVWLNTEWRTLIALAEVACKAGYYSEGYALAQRLTVFLRLRKHNDEATELWAEIQRTAHEAGHHLLAARAKSYQASSTYSGARRGNQQKRFRPTNEGRFPSD